MPLDTNLIGQTLANWQQPPDILATYGKLQALRNGIAQSQIQQQQLQQGTQALQTGALNLEQQQKTISGQKALAEAIRANVTPGDDGTPNINHQAVVKALGEGGNGDLISGYMAGVEKQRADKAARTKTELDNRVNSLELATRAFNAANDQKGWNNAIATAHGLGIDTAAIGIPEAFSPEAKTAVVNYGLSVKEKLAAEAAATTAQASAERATAAGTQADTAKEKERLAKVTAAKQAIGAATDQATLDAAYNNVITAGATPQEIATLPHVYAPATVNAFRRSLLTAEQQTQADQAAENARNTEADRKAGRANAAGHLALEQKRFNATLGAGLDANGQPLSPDALKAAALQDPTAQAIAAYRIAPPPATTRGGQENPIWKKILAINPTYKPGEFAARNKVQQDFSASGATGKIITAADTALAHLGAVSQAGAALHNNDIQLLNQIANDLGAQTGSSPKIVYNAIVSMVGPEISKAVIGEAGAAHEREKMENNFSSSVNDKTREATISAAAGLLTQRIQKQAQAYQSSMDIPFDLTTRISPESQALMQRYGAGGHAAPAAYANTATDASGHKIGTNDGGKTWFDVQTGAKIQ